MTPTEFRAIRKALGLTLEQWGDALGYSGPHRRQQVNDMEGNRKTITPMCARLAEEYRKHGLPKYAASGWIIERDKTLETPEPANQA